MQIDKLHGSLINEIKLLIEDSKQQLAITVNTAITKLYWNIGKNGIKIK